ncbi:MAG: Rossmann-like and DUF2520 domain-containing protein [Lepagella sp.]
MEQAKKKIGIIGTGNVGTHLRKALASAADTLLVASRSLEGLRRDSDLYLLCVSDGAIREVAERVSPLIAPDSVLAHTSGATPMSILEGVHPNIGVLYPLQTFTKDVELRYEEIPFFIEGMSPEVEDCIEKTARLISDKVMRINSLQRLDLHVASVVSCNFINHLWALSSKFLEDRGIDFQLMMPLIRETLRKGEAVGAVKAQTGPARRQDFATIERHLACLEMYPEMQAIYRQISDSIIKMYNKE